MFSKRGPISFIPHIALFGAAFFASCTLFSGVLFASTVDDYRRRLDTVDESLQQLRVKDDGPDTSGIPESKLIAAIRAAVPSTEKIEWPGGSVETDNAWLTNDLDAFAAERSDSKRTVILDRMNDRLQAIRQKVDELKNAAAAAPSKDDEKRKLGEILRREEYQKLPEERESLFQKWRRSISEWLDKMFPRLRLPQQESAGSGSLSVVLQALLYVLLAVGLGYLIYRILPLLSGRLSRRKKASSGDRIILGERIRDDQSAQDLFGEAEMLARNGQLRLAIRKGYIALLCDLSDRKIVGLARHKTNRDYLRDLRSKPDLAKNVGGLTVSFERHWYGSDASSETDWDEFRDLYLSTIRGV